MITRATEAQISEFAQTQRRLIQLEREAEIHETSELQGSLSAQELQRRGLCLLQLNVTGDRVGLGGHSLIDLAPTTGMLVHHRIGVGDIVTIRPQRARPNETPKRSSSIRRPKASPSSGALTGVVSRVTESGLTVAIDEWPDHLPEAPLRLDRVANEVTFRRLEEVLDRLERYRGGPADRLLEIAFGAQPPDQNDAVQTDELEGCLDTAQRDAVRFAMSSGDIALIHGPPGTGKTTTLVELIHQMVASGQSVLATAPSNIAVDNLVERLSDRGLAVVRIGHPARLLPSVTSRSLAELVEKSDGMKIAADVRREIDQAYRDLRRVRYGRERGRIRQEIRRLREEVRELEKFAVRQVVTSADVVLSTTIGAADRSVAGIDFDLVVIDEAAQSLEVAAWIPLLKGRRAVLCGDHQQLPPTIRSQEAATRGFSTTLFERLHEQHGSAITRMLTRQYRMHQRIMNWSSVELYGGRVEADETVREHLLMHLPDCAQTFELQTPVLLIDTAGCDLEEETVEHTSSRSNRGETDIVTAHVQRLIEAGVPAHNIAVITPYNAQVAQLRNALRPKWPELEIGSVDGFQGREKEAIVLSLVRSNRTGDVGFLSDERRMNVAVTRARRHVAIIGDSATVSSHPFLCRLVEYCQAHGEYRSAWEYR